MKNYDSSLFSKHYFIHPCDLCYFMLLFTEETSTSRNNFIQSDGISYDLKLHILLG